MIRTGAANLRSVTECFRRLQYEVHLIEQPEDIERADIVVLPGVGAFGAAMGALAEAGFVVPLQSRLKEGRKTLCICLGMQLLAATSDESPGVTGLGVIDVGVERLDSGGAILRIPQMGWNRVAGSGLVASGDYYFANSFGLRTVPNGWKGTGCDYGGQLVASIERDGVLACQFHPELSGQAGSELVARWLA